MRTEPMLLALPADLPWTLNAYLLLDGVSVTELPRKLYQWSDTPTFEPLYHDSRWQELLDLSPCLVALDGSQDPYPAGVPRQRRTGMGLPALRPGQLADLVAAPAGPSVRPTSPWRAGAAAPGRPGSDA